MSLVGKAGFQSDLAEGHVAGGEQVRCILNPKPAKVIANGALEMLTETTRQMSGMYFERSGNRIQ